MRKSGDRAMGVNGGSTAAGARALLRRAEVFRRGGLAGWTTAIGGLVAAAFAGPALAGPEGATVVRGDVDIQRNGNHTVIRAGDRSIINYRSFDIGSNESVRFVQPGADARVLNRINSASPTRIDGSLMANGRVYIINPAGVVFGQGAVVNVNQLFAAGGALSDSDFIAGRNNFTNLTGSVTNQGTITGSLVGLVGSHVANVGSIVAPRGAVVMAAGEDVIIAERHGQVHVRVTGAAAAAEGKAAVEQSGVIDAERGRVIMGAGDMYALAVRHTGTTRAKDVQIQGQGTGVVSVSGTVDVSDDSRAGRGGSVEVTGERVLLTGATIDASGRKGGGSVRIGGDVMGRGDLRRAVDTRVDADTTIKADATLSGRGGSVVVWSDNSTGFYGEITAKGGSRDGHGGFIETSSKYMLDVRGAKVEAGSSAGNGGVWLLDPRNDSIEANPTAGGTFDGGSPDTFTPNADDAIVDVAVVNATLGTDTSVVITTNDPVGTQAGNITVNDAIAKAAGAGSATLTLRAANDITIANTISFSSGQLNVELFANDQSLGDDLNTAAGNVAINATIDATSITTRGVDFSNSAQITATGGAIDIQHTGTGTVGAGVLSDTSTNIVTDGALGIGGDIEGGASVTLHAGNGGTGDLTFTAGGVEVDGDAIVLRAGSGSGSAAQVSYANNPLFRDGAGTALPTSFTHRQDATIAGTGVADLARFQGGDVTGLNYTIQSDGGTVTINTDANADVANSNLTLVSSTGVNLLNDTTTGSLVVTGPLSVSGSHRTTGGTITASSAITLVGGTTFDSTNAGGNAAGANITLGAIDGTTAATESLNLNAGTAGDIALGAVGATTRLDSFGISNANNVTGSTLRSQIFLQVAGGGTTQFTGLIDTAGGGGVDITGTVVTLSAINAANGPVVINNSGQLTLGGSVTCDSFFDQTGTGAVSLGGNITAADSAISFAGAVTATADGLVMNSGAGTTTFASTLALGTNTFTITGDEIDFTGGAGSVTGTGSLTLQGAAAGTTIGTGGGAGTLDLSDTDLAALADGFTLLTIGRVDQAGAIDVGSSAFNDATTIRNQGGTISITDAVTGTDGTLTFTATGINLGSTVTTQAGAVQFNGPVTLTANSGVDTTNAGGSAGAAIGFSSTVNGTSAGTEDLDLRAGAGNITVTGAAGQTTRLGDVTVTSAAASNYAAVSAASFTQSAGTGLTTFGGALNTDAAGGVDLTGATFTLGAVTTTGGGGVTINNSGLATLGGAINSDGNFNQSGAGAVSLGANVTASDADITFGGAVTATANGLVLNGGTGTTTLNNTLALAANNFTITSDEIDLAGGAGSVTGTGTITLQNATLGATVDVGSPGGGTGTLDLSDADIAALADGFTAVQLGRSDTGGVMTVGTLTITDRTVLRAPGASIAFTGAVTGTGNAQLIANTAAINLGANITTAGGLVQLNAPITLSADVTIDTTNGGAATGGALTIAGTIEGTTAGQEDLALRTGTANISVTGAAGGTTRLGELRVISGNVVGFQAVSAASVRQDGGTGSTTFAGLVNTNTAAGVSLTGNQFTLSNGLTATNGGGLALANAGTATLTGAISLDGALSQTGAGAVNLNGDVTTTDDDVAFNGAVTLGGGARRIDTGTGAGDIAFLSTLGGGQNLNLAAGTGAVSFNGAVGTPVTRLGVLTVEDSGSVNQVSTARVAGLDYTSTGDITIGGLVDSSGGVSTDGNNLTATGAIIAAGGPVDLQHQGSVSIGGQLTSSSTVTIASGLSGAGDLSFTTAGLTVGGTDITLTAGDGNGGAGTTAVVDLSNTPIFRGAAGGSTSPTSFTLRQDGTIADGDIVAATAFAGGLGGMNYTLESRDGSLTLSDATKVDDSALTLAGATGLAIDNALSVRSLNATGVTTLGGSVTATAGGITFNDAVTLTANADFSAGTNTITFNGLDIVNFDSVVTADEVDLLGAMAAAGGNLTLQPETASLDVNVNGTGTGFELTSAEMAQFADGFGSITIGRGDGSGVLRVLADLTVSDPLTLRMTNGAINSAGVIQGTGDATLAFSGATLLGRDVRTEGQTISFDDDVVIAGNVELATTDNSAAGANISVSGTVNADLEANNRNLRFTAGTGSTSVTGAIGSGQALQTVSATGAGFSAAGVRTTGGQAYIAEVAMFGDMISTTSGRISVAGPLFLGADVTIQTAGADATNDIVVTGPIDTLTGDPRRALTLNAGSGDITLNGVLGGGEGLASLTATGATIALSGNQVTTSGAQVYTGATSLGGSLVGDSVRFVGGLTITSDLTVTATSFARFEDTVNSEATEANDLTVNSPDTLFAGEIGTGTDGVLGLLFTDSSGVTVINTGAIAADQIGLRDQIRIESDLTITATGAVGIADTVNSGTAGARSLTINTPGDTSLGGVIGGANPLASITIGGGGRTLLGTSVTTTGAQMWNDAIVLAGDSSLTGDTITLASTVDSDGTPRTLTVSGGAGGINAINGIGRTSALASVTMTASGIRVANVTTTGGQTYTGVTTLSDELRSTTGGVINIAGDLRLAGDSTIRSAGAAATDDVVFGGAINSVTTPFDLTVLAGAGDVTVAGDIGLSAAAGSAQLAELNMAGNTMAVRNVRTTGSQLYTGSLSLPGNLNVTGVGSIGIGGPVTLTGDAQTTTTNGAIVFGGAIESDGTARSLIVNTGGANETRFGGSVGENNRLTTLVVTGTGGPTRINGGFVRTINDQQYDGPVELGANVVMDANDVTFASTLNSDGIATPRSLTINTTTIGADVGETLFSGNVGTTARLRSISTNSDGLTRVGGEIRTSEGMTFADPVRIINDAVLDGGNGTLFFRSTIDTDLTATDRFLTLLSDAVASSSNTPFKFAGQIGQQRRLGGLQLGADRATPPTAATAVWSDGYQADGTIRASDISAADTFRITTGTGGFTMGRNQKLTTFGSLVINTPGAAALGDLTALTNITVTAGSIQIRLRDGGQIEDNFFESPVDQLDTDLGVDFVASGTIDFSVTPTTTGTGSAPTFATNSGAPDAELQGFLHRQFTNGVRLSLFTDTRAGQTGRALPLDLKSEGPSIANTATSIAGAIPRDQNQREIVEPPMLDPALREDLREMGVATRDLGTDEIVEFLVGRALYRDLPLKSPVLVTASDYQVTVNRLSSARVTAAVEAYRELAFEMSTTADGQTVRVKRFELIQQTLADAWERYDAKVDQPDGAAFRAYLETLGAEATEADREALRYLNQIREVLQRIDELGLAPFEASIPRRKLLGEVKPAVIPEGDFLEAIGGGNQVAMK